MPQTIPLQAVPAQQVTVTLGGQVCQIKVAQKGAFLFLDLYVNNGLIIAGVICENRNRIVRSAYLGFIGDLAFVDIRAGEGGNQDPQYAGLGTRYFLRYLAAGELA